MLEIIPGRKKRKEIEMITILSPFLFRYPENSCRRYISLQLTKRNEDRVNICQKQSTDK